MRRCRFCISARRSDSTRAYDKLLHRSFKSGIDWFDTALSYGWGSSHRAIASFIGQMGDRNKLWLTSKSGARSPKRLLGGADQALQELQTDYLDLFLMHGIDDVEMLDKEYIRAGESLKRAGKIKYFGFSCHDGNVAELLDAAATRGGIDAILFRYNFRRYGERELNLAMDKCHKAGIGLLAMKTMGSVPSDLETVAGFKSDNFTLGQAKLKSVWADERIASICSEMDSVQRVRENVSAARSESTLSAREAHQLNQLAHFTADYACLGCKHHCERVAQGIPIADTSALFVLLRELPQARSRQGIVRRGGPCRCAVPIRLCWRKPRRSVHKTSTLPLVSRAPNGCWRSGMLFQQH